MPISLHGEAEACPSPYMVKLNQADKGFHDASCKP